MAKTGRVIDSNISLSETMADLGDPVAVLLATWLPLHADDQGRLEASPRRLKAQVCPMLDFITAAAIATALQRMAEVGYIHLYQHNGTPLLQLVSWWRWNDGQEWVAASDYPAPPGWVDCPSGRGAAREHAAHCGFGSNCPGESGTVGDNPVVVATVPQPISTPTTTPAPLNSAPDPMDSANLAASPPPDLLDAAPAPDPHIRLRAIVPVLEKGGLVLSPLAAEDLVVTVAEHPRADEQVAARVLAKWIPNLPGGYRVNPAFVGQVLAIVEDFPEAEIQAQLSITPSDRCNPAYVRAALLGRRLDHADRGGEPFTGATPPWEQVDVPTEAEFIAVYGEEGARICRNWHAQQQTCTLAGSRTGP